MTSRLIQIGNSKGIRLPKNLIDKYQLTNDLELIETEDGILIKSSKPRQNWVEMITREGVEKSIENEVIETEFDKTDWTW